jgi:hypothetical protein
MVSTTGFTRPSVEVEAITVTITTKTTMRMIMITGMKTLKKGGNNGPFFE